MYSGYLSKRSTPISPPPMQSEEDSKTSMSPKLTTEILGVSEWDGKGRANSYPFGFLLVTHTGGTYYVTAPTLKDRDEWIIHVRRALECVFANTAVVPFKPSKIIQNRPPLSTCMVCPRSSYTISSPIYCKSCGRAFYSSEYVSDLSTLLQVGAEDAEKVCVDCRNAQACVLWIKSLNYVHVMTLHEMTPAVLSDVNKFKNSFKLRRRLSPRLEMAAELLSQGNISPAEFEELRRVDHAYTRETLHEESRRLKSAVEAFGDDMQTIVGILLNPHLTEGGGRASYHCVVLRILEIADSAPDLIDFYFPQILQVHLQEARLRTAESLVKVDLLQQALLVMAQKYPALGLKLAWSLLASANDYAEKRVTQVQFAACTCLLLQLEMAVTGVVSSIADQPFCRQLARVFRGAAHQQQEMGFEIGALFLVRRRLQEVYDSEEAARLQRTLGSGGGPPAVGGDKQSSTSAEEGDQDSTRGQSQADDRITSDSEGGDAAKKSPARDNSDSVAAATAVSKPLSETSCLELLRQLGVGQAGAAPRRSARAPSFNYVSDEDSDDEPDYAAEHGQSDRTTPSGSSSGRSHRRRSSQSSAQHHVWSGFAAQLDFMDRLTEVVEGLRFVDRPLRTETLVREMKKWNEAPAEHLGWDPTTIAGEPHYRITRVLTEECRVFRTKARAPSMIVCEVVRDDLYHASTDTGTGTVLKERKRVGNNSGDCVPDSDEQENKEDADGSEGSHSAGSSTDRVPAVPPRAVSDELHSGVHDRNSFGSPHGHLLLTASTADPKRHAEVEASIGQIDQELLQASQSQSLSRAVAERQMMESLGLVKPPLAGGLKQSASMRSLDAHSPHGSDSGTSSKTWAGPGHGSSSPGLAARQVLFKRRSSTFLSSNRLAVNAEDMMRSTLSASPTSSASNNTVGVALKLSAATLQNSAQNNLHDGGSPVRMSHSGKFLPGSASGNSSATGQPSDADGNDSNSPRNGSAIGHEDAVSLSVHSLDLSDSASVRSSGGASVGGPPTMETAQVTKKVLSSAQRLLQSGKIDEREYEQLIACDLQYHEQSAREEAQIARCRVETAFGEPWQAKKERVVGCDRLYMHLQRGADGSLADDQQDDLEGVTADSGSSWPAWDLRCFIVKSNDDLRQEVCCLQLMQLCKEVFEHFGLGPGTLFLKPYRIVSTGASTGIVHVLTDATSLDALKKGPGFTTLSNYFKKTYDSSAERLAQAKRNFAASLAAYSLFSYILLIKDRHNGNLLIDAEGHIIHIDFGFLLGIAPGGSFSVESAPFKLTEEMVDVLGGLDSPLFGEFVNAFTKGFIALQANAENIVGALQVLSLHSTFPCFAGKQAGAIIDKLRGRFRTELSVGDAVKHCLDLVTNSYGNYGTRQYDTFQYLTNGIFP